MANSHLSDCLETLGVINLGEVTSDERASPGPHPRGDRDGDRVRYRADCRPNVARC